MSDYYEFCGMPVAVGSGFDGWLRAWPWESEWRVEGRPTWAWHAAARFLNGLPTYGTITGGE